MHIWQTVMPLAEIPPFLPNFSVASLVRSMNFHAWNYFGLMVFFLDLIWLQKSQNLFFIMCKLGQLMSPVISFCHLQPDWLGLLVEYACRYPAFDHVPLFLSSAINCSLLTDNKEIFSTCWAWIMLRIILPYSKPCPHIWTLKWLSHHLGWLRNGTD